MSVDFKKLDAALFALEGFISRLLTHGDNLEHTEYYLTMIRSVRGSISHDLGFSHKESDDVTEQRLRGMPDAITSQPIKKRAKDKGQMSTKQRRDISKKMKAYWKKRRRAEKRVGR